MKNPLVTAVFAVTLSIVASPSAALAQQSNKAVVCKVEVFPVSKPLPELTYQCPANATSDSDDRILRSPERREAIKHMLQELENFTEISWWNSPVSGLNACYLHGTSGTLSAEEIDQFNGPEYQPAVLGDNRLRLVLIADPCYQTSYNGSNAFVLYRKEQKVFASQVLDGYYSRLGKSVFLHLLYTNLTPSIRIETANIAGMRPEYLDYYFAIDKATNKAVPRKPFKRYRKGD